jgi:hypothetical protein
VRVADNLPPSSAGVTESGNLNLTEPSGPYRPVMGLLYSFLLAPIDCCEKSIFIFTILEDYFVFPKAVSFSDVAVNKLCSRKFSHRSVRSLYDVCVLCYRCFVMAESIDEVLELFHQESS